MRTGEAHGLFDYSPIVDRPPLRWPNGAHVAVWVVPNIEHYEIWTDTDHRQVDIRNASRADYGNRVGIWRLMEVFDRHGVRGTVALNSAVCRHYPRVMEEAQKRGWEFMGHGLTNSQRLDELSAEDEDETIRRTVAEISECTGQPVRGWLGPGLTESPRTLDLIKKHGVEYVCDWVNDDQPYRMSNGLYSIPYTIELNDVPLFRAPTFAPHEFERMIRDSFDTLYAEGEETGRVLCLALHPFLVGAPHRIAYLDRALAYIRSHKHVWVTTGSEIIDWYRKSEGETEARRR